MIPKVKNREFWTLPHSDFIVRKEIDMSLVYIFLANGFEEVEGLTSVDLLRRSGADVKMVSIMESQTVIGAHGICVKADMMFDQIREEADLLVLPGGMPGTNYLKEHEGLAALLKEYNERKQWIGAICAAPGVFGKLGFLEGRRVTSYPGCLDGCSYGEYCEDTVVVDGHIITSRGVGTAIDFALTLIEILSGKEEAAKIADSILYDKYAVE